MAKNHDLPTEPHYHTCCVCTAKWYSTRRYRTCVRCGSGRLLRERRSPPWRLYRENQRKQKGM